MRQWITMWRLRWVLSFMMLNEAAMTDHEQMMDAQLGLARRQPHAKVDLMAPLVTPPSNERNDCESATDRAYCVVIRLERAGESAQREIKVLLALGKRDYSQAELLLLNNSVSIKQARAALVWFLATLESISETHVETIETLRRF